MGIGENGSGKSTLISQIAGISADEGEMTLDVMLMLAQSAGRESSRVSMVVQELGIVKSLPAGVNIFWVGQRCSLNSALSAEKLNGGKRECEKWDCQVNFKAPR